ncbi:hypothetical protein HDE74_000359 [Janthinobacterium sp. K2Li3]|nr:hypothetical protein [Janthinobacterium sp. K2C7]MBB5379673.1 hypothetical protein [Janthinobacterium sp. K2Li3]MBB5386231.1 hypothetical protein [Janthinobacterium sp. K2E3]
MPDLLKHRGTVTVVSACLQPIRVEQAADDRAGIV